MTDARLRGEWLTAAAHDGLSDAAYRVLHNALMHSAEQGTDGAIARRELRFLYPGPLKSEVLDELTAAGFWAETDEGFQMIGWATTLGQSTAADVEAYRRSARERQRRRRERLSGTSDAIGDGDSLQAEVVTGDITDSVTRDVTGNVGKDRTGPDRPVLARERTRARAMTANATDTSGSRLAGVCTATSGRQISSPRGRQHDRTHARAETHRCGDHHARCHRSDRRATRPGRRTTVTISEAYADLGGGLSRATAATDAPRRFNMVEAKETPGLHALGWHMFDPISGWCGCGQRDDGATAPGSPAWRAQVERALPGEERDECP